MSAPWKLTSIEQIAVSGNRDAFDEDKARSIRRVSTRLTHPPEINPFHILNASTLRIR
jgi:hypothetical protein